MIKLQKKESCCGCTACAEICPKNCIEMKEDEEFFLYPHVNENECINCHLCEKVCPVLNLPELEKQKNLQACLVRTKDHSILRKCTSGGVFTTIARETIQNGGVAYGVIYGADYIVKYARIDKLENIWKLSGSKYVQSNVGNIFNEVQNDLKNGLKVVFCGTPCQVAGLYNFLGKEYENLLLVDLVCHGVPSPGLWKDYLEYIEKTYGKLKKVNFRSKKLGYHAAVMEEQFENGRTLLRSARTNFMTKCYFSNSADRPICYECPFKTIQRCSDLTLFDGWHAGEYVEGLKDDDRGYTIVILQSEKGREQLKSCRHLFAIEIIDLEKAVRKDGVMIESSVKRPENRDVFYSVLRREGIEKTVEKLFPVSAYDKGIEYFKQILFKIGLLKLLKQKIRK